MHDTKYRIHRLLDLRCSCTMYIFIKPTIGRLYLIVLKPNAAITFKLIHLSGNAGNFVFFTKSRYMKYFENVYAGIWSNWNMQSKPLKYYNSKILNIESIVTHFKWMQYATLLCVCVGSGQKQDNDDLIYVFEPTSSPPIDSTTTTSSNWYRMQCFEMKSIFLSSKALHAIHFKNK